MSEEDSEGQIEKHDSKKSSTPANPLKLYIIASLIALIYGACVFLSSVIAYFPTGWAPSFSAHSIFRMDLMLIMLYILASFILLPVSIIGLLINTVVGKDPVKKRRIFTILSSILIFYGEVFVIFLCGRKVEHVVFQNAFERAASQGQVLIDAIEHYKLDNNSYPPTLAELVPDYLPKIPPTGLAGYPDYDYMLPDDERLWEDERYIITQYQLYISTPIGGPNWDCFVYRPEGDYPEYIYGGSTELFGDWAYVHE